MRSAAGELKLVSFILERKATVPGRLLGRACAGGGWRITEPKRVGSRFRTFTWWKRRLEDSDWEVVGFIRGK